MTKTLLLALSLLASIAWLQAQSQYPQTGSSQTGAGQTTVQGCLRGSDGNYTLTTKRGTVYQLQGDTSKLSEHVGHEVAITGSTSTASNASNPAPGTPTGAKEVGFHSSLPFVAQSNNRLPDHTERPEANS